MAGAPGDAAALREPRDRGRRSALARGGPPAYPQPQLSKAIRNKNGLYLAIDSNHGWCPYNCTNRPLIGDEEGQSWDLFYLRHLN